MNTNIPESKIKYYRITTKKIQKSFSFVPHKKYLLMLCIFYMFVIIWLRIVVVALHHNPSSPSSRALFFIRPYLFCCCTYPKATVPESGPRRKNWNGWPEQAQVLDTIEHRGHKVEDPDLEINILRSNYTQKASKKSKLIIFSKFRQELSDPCFLCELVLSAMRLWRKCLKGFPPVPPVQKINTATPLGISLDYSGLPGRVAVQDF